MACWYCRVQPLPRLSSSSSSSLSRAGLSEGQFSLADTELLGQWTGDYKGKWAPSPAWCGLRQSWGVTGGTCQLTGQKGWVWQAQLGCVPLTPPLGIHLVSHPLPLRVGWL